MMSALDVFQWLENTGIGSGIRASNWLFPVVEAAHIVGLALIGGAVLIVDLRLLGLGLREQPVARVARAAQPWMNGSLVVMLCTGVLLFLSEAVKCYNSFAFWVKITSLALAIVFAYTIRRRVATADQTRIAPIWSKLVGATSILLWAGVGWGGRWIGFS
jgi:uncharacterized membrane protein SirB2